MLNSVGQNMKIHQINLSPLTTFKKMNHTPSHSRFYHMLLRINELEKTLRHILFIMRPRINDQNDSKKLNLLRNGIT